MFYTLKKKQLAIFFSETTVFFSRKGEGIHVLNLSCSVWMQASGCSSKDALLILFQGPSSNPPDSNSVCTPPKMEKGLLSPSYLLEDDAIMYVV